MATFSKNILSASTDGRAILVAATASAGTTIHTGSSTATDFHEVWLYASNPDTVQHTLTIEWGGTTSPNDIIKLYLPAESGLTIVAPGLLLKGNATPLVIKAFADTANKVTITGYVNEIA
jgi:hypothetical protein